MDLRNVLDCSKMLAGTISIANIVEMIISSSSMEMTIITRKKRWKKSLISVMHPVKALRFLKL